jgi:2-C-methyl-D-erythritol 4-phosphate cytidylyltransferase
VVTAGSSHSVAPVAGVPMVVRVVRSLLAAGLADQVNVLAGGAQRSRVARACSAEPVAMCHSVEQALSGVGAHAVQRPTDTGSDGPVTVRGGDIVLLHDACRPLAPVELAAGVLDAVRGGHAMAAPVLPLPDTVKRVDGRGVVVGTPDRSALRVLQTPLALLAELVPADLGTDPLQAVRTYTAGGGTVHTVAGHPAAFAVHSAWDLELAELVARGTITL